MAGTGIRVATWVVAAAASGGLLAGCADESTASATPRPATSDPAVVACEHTVGSTPWHGVVRVRGRTVAIDAFDDYFSPTCLVVPWATRVRVTVTNRGHLPHTMTLPGTGLDVDVDAGQTVFVDLPATTRPLRYLCTFHVSERMFGAVVPRPAPGG